MFIFWDGGGIWGWLIGARQPALPLPAPAFLFRNFPFSLLLDFLLIFYTRFFKSLS
jgi:hypothetical protein